MTATNTPSSARTPRARRPWTTPRIVSSEVFTKAALACCQPTDPIFGTPLGAPEGSSGAALPAC